MAFSTSLEWDYETRFDEKFSVGDVIYFMPAIVNVGSAKAETFEAVFELKNESGNVLKTYSTTYSDGLTASTWEWRWTSIWNFRDLAAGVYTLTATIDAENAVDETDETDNVYVGTFTVVDQTKEAPSTVVTTNADVVDAFDGEISLREAIAYAQKNESLGSTITFDASLKGETIKLDGAAFRVAKDGITIDASALYDAENDVPGLTIDAGGETRAFYLNGGTEANPITLNGLTITGGLTAYGAGVFVEPDAALLAKNCVFADNKTTGSGGGALCVDGWASLEDCVFTGNSAASDGGAIYVATSASLTATGLDISNNSALCGGGLYLAPDATLTLADSTVADNVATVYGGGGLQLIGEATISNSTITRNSSPTYGGGVNVDGVATIVNSEITANTAQYGGGIHTDGTNGVLTLTGSTVSNNVATSHGGGLCGDGRGTVENVVFSGNTAISGGAIHIGNSGSLTIVDSEIIDNTASNEGGGISVSGDATLTLTGSLVDSNEITAGTNDVYGGGICAYGTLTVENSDITNNVASGV
ncbi:MAG: hypothetical protein IJE77_11680, partial [Thermoguttaceae bacterium]|nr:hypothetical protein [Thermoguttaceae bacterium]